MANATLTINFQSLTADDPGEDGNEKFIQLALDDVQNELLYGKTSGFTWGQIIYFKMYTNCSTVTFYTSEGPVTGGVDGTDEVTDYLAFTQPPVAAGGVVENNTASLSLPATGSFLAVGSGSGSVSLNPLNSSEALASAVGIGIYKATYDAAYIGKKITGPTEPAGLPADTSYPLVIVAYGA